MNNNKVVVCAYHNVGYRCLEELLRQGADVAMVFTHQDSLTEEIWFSSVRQLAEKHHIPWRTTDINAPENIALLREIAPGFIFSFYYRNMLGQEVLDIAGKGALNLHGSLLPRYRGRVPVNWVIINGESETGVTLHYMVEKPDAGDMVDQEKVPILFTDTALDLFNKVTDAAVKVIGRSWPLLAAGKAPRIPLDLAAGSYFGGRKPADGLINWTKDAVRIYNLVRGVTHPYPGAFTFLDHRKVTIWQAWPVEGKGALGRVVSTEPLLVGTNEGLLEIRSLQIEGDSEITAKEFVSSHPVNNETFTN
jgi:methionyl-tRNA formyltransferase